MTPSGLTATSYPLTPATYGAAHATTLTVVRTRFGSVVANDRGQVLYTYTEDTATTSACDADWCLVDWPPLQSQGAPTKAAVDQRTSGSDQWCRRHGPSDPRRPSPVHLRRRSTSR